MENEKRKLPIMTLVKVKLAGKFARFLQLYFYISPAGARSKPTQRSKYERLKYEIPGQGEFQTQ